MGQVTDAGLVRVADGGNRRAQATGSLPGPTGHRTPEENAMTASSHPETGIVTKSSPRPVAATVDRLTELVAAEGHEAVRGDRPAGRGRARPG